LREALLRDDTEFVQMRAPRRAPSGRGERTRRFAWLAPFMRRPGRTVACAVCTALLTGIGVNALFFQTARHPAPIFGAPASVRAKAAPPAVSVSSRPDTSLPQNDVPVPPPRPVDFAASSQQRIAIDPPKDQIGSLLKASAPSSPDNTRIVQAAQRALIALGHSLKADGVMGASTRQAIEKFEASRRLPVTGELTPRTLRELAAQTGVAVQ
jgi:hypothetical protein